MTYKTHREFSVSFVIIANALMWKLGILDINYYISLIVLILFGKQGALFPDVDHIWRNVKEKTILNKVINTIIHITKGTHRSWQTHSIDIWVISLIGSILASYNYLNGNNRTVMTLVIIGFWAGWFSHLFSDMLSSDGIRLFCWSKKIKLKLVPKQAKLIKNIIVSIIMISISIITFLVRLHDVISVSILIIGLVYLGFSIRIKNMKFNTGGEWENIVYRMIYTLNVVFYIFALVFPFIPEF